MASKSSSKYEINTELSSNQKQSQGQQTSSSSTKVVDHSENVQRGCCKLLGGDSDDSGGMKMHEAIKILVLGPGDYILEVIYAKEITEFSYLFLNLR